MIEYLIERLVVTEADVAIDSENLGMRSVTSKRRLTTSLSGNGGIVGSTSISLFDSASMKLNLAKPSKSLRLEVFLGRPITFLSQFTPNVYVPHETKTILGHYF